MLFFGYLNFFLGLIILVFIYLRNLKLEYFTSFFERFENQLECGICTTIDTKSLGVVDDCCMDAKEASNFNEYQIKKILDELTKLHYFRYYTTYLDNECQFKKLRDPNGYCSIKDCAVCTCDPNEIDLPKSWLEQATLDFDNNSYEDINNRKFMYLYSLFIITIFNNIMLLKQLIVVLVV